MLSVASSRTCGYDPASLALSCALVTIMSSVASVSCADGLSSAWPVASGVPVPSARSRTRVM